MKLLSWNVNGIRAVLRRNFLEFLDAEQPDVLCLQETKADPNDVEQLWPLHYASHWSSAKKKGYAGTAVFTRKQPLNVRRGIGLQECDDEGRAITVEFQGFYLVNVYVPNSKAHLERLPFRLEWNKVLLAYLKQLEKTKPVVLCGDLNVAHTELDIAHPKSNAGSPGFTPQERAGFDELLGEGFIDTFREFEKGGGHYTWWSPFANARKRNYGWRIDYFVISKALRPRLKSAFIRCSVMGSDHCPVGIELDLE